VAPFFRSLAAALILALGSGLGRAEAQAADSTYAGRALARFLERNHADTRLPDSLRSMTIGRLDSLADDYFALMDDAGRALSKFPPADLGPVVRRMTSRTPE
jgi:hypothetical protein